jgi:hypothetical protein
MRKILLSLATVMALGGQPTCAAFADAPVHRGAGGHGPLGLSGSLGSGLIGGAGYAGGHNSSRADAVFPPPSDLVRSWCYWHPYSCYVSG